MDSDLPKDCVRVTVHTFTENPYYADSLLSTTTRKDKEGAYFETVMKLRYIDASTRLTTRLEA